MESKLKQLKVVDLKDILAKASVSVPAKANKQDLINKILAAPAAVEAYQKRYPSATPKKLPPSAQVASQAVSLAPPEDLDFDEPIVIDDSPVAIDPTLPSHSSKTVTAAAPNNPPTTLPDASQPSEPSKEAEPVNDNDKDEELKKRRARAERFGIPLVEPKSPQPRARRGSAKHSPKIAAAVLADPEKLKARANRFGTGGQKRPAPAEDVDPEEQERRKRRAERFQTDN